MREPFKQALTVHQYHFRASAGEAITQHMLLIQQALAEVGVSGKIFSSEIKNLPQGRVHKWSLDSAWDCDLLLIHHSQANPEVKSLSRLEIPKALIYHSQPPESFYVHDRDMFRNLIQGKKQLSFWKHQNVPAFAVSQFGVNELKKLGFPRAEILPLMHLEPQSAALEDAEPLEPKHLLFVGKLMPHKRQAQLIELFFYLKSEFPKGSQLHLVGTGDPLYTKYLKLLVKQLGLSSFVTLTGKLTEAELKNYYSFADAFICVSDHEGFCLPVVEAMQQQVPVFYRPHSGIQETMAGAGVEFLSSRPVDHAAIIASVLKHPPAVRALLKKQNQRLKEMARFQNKKKLQEMILGMCQRLPIAKGSLNSKPKVKPHDAPFVH